MDELDLDELRDDLDEFSVDSKTGGRSSREERIIAGFEEIQRFVERNGRAPLHGEGRDIFERIYAVRLDRLRTSDECRSLLAPLDGQGLLGGAAAIADAAMVDDDALLADLEGFRGASSLTELKHVRSRADIQAAEEIADRKKCADFEAFAPLFGQAEHELKTGVRRTRTFGINPSIDAGDFFILNGQLTYVAEVGVTFAAPNGQPDARLRVIFASGTESDLLKRSLQRALYKDEAGRRLTVQDAGPLFGDAPETDDVDSGTIYVLRSRSEHPFIAEHRDLIHKIGVTGGDLRSRLANAANDATYLLADVDVVASYKLAGVDRIKLENLFHRLFAAAQLDLTIADRFGRPVKPREWFLVPLNVINEAVARIRDGTIVEMVYDPETARLVKMD